MARWMSSMVASWRRKRDCCACADPTDASIAASRKSTFLELGMFLRNFRWFQFFIEDGIRVFVRDTAAQQHRPGRFELMQRSYIGHEMSPHSGINFKVAGAAEGSKRGGKMLWQSFVQWRISIPTLSLPRSPV